MRRSVRVTLACLAVAAGAGAVAWTQLPGDGAQAGAASGERTRQVELILAGIAQKTAGDSLNLDLATRAQTLIRTCMKKDGFDYHPVDPHAIVDTTTETDFRSLAYAQRYGFGIAAWPVFAPDWSGNREYQATLSTQRQADYAAASSRCLDTANEKANADFGIPQANQENDELDRRVRASADYVKAREEWQRCARAAGHTEASRAALMDALRARHDDLVNRISGDAATPTDAAAQRRIDANPAFQVFRRDEINAAVGTFPCSQRLDAVYARIYTSMLPR